MSSVISFHLKGERLERLRRAARALGRTPGEVAAALGEEGLRQRDFPGIEFRDTAIGRQAYPRGTRLAVWMVGVAARDLGDWAAVADHLMLSPVEAALARAYADAHADEVAAAIADNEAASDRLAALLPPDQVVAV
jgi:hypothetical protein